MSDWLNIPAKTRMELLREYKKNGMSYSEAKQDFLKTYLPGREEPVYFKKGEDDEREFKIKESPMPQDETRPKEYDYIRHDIYREDPNSFANKMKRWREMVGRNIDKGRDIGEKFNENIVAPVAAGASIAFPEVAFVKHADMISDLISGYGKQNDTYSKIESSAEGTSSIIKGLADLIAKNTNSTSINSKAKNVSNFIKKNEKYLTRLGGIGDIATQTYGFMNYEKEDPTPVTDKEKDIDYIIKKIHFEDSKKKILDEIDKTKPKEYNPESDREYGGILKTYKGGGSLPRYGGDDFAPQDATYREPIRFLDPEEKQNIDIRVAKEREQQIIERQKELDKARSENRFRGISGDLDTRKMAEAGIDRENRPTEEKVKEATLELGLGLVGSGAYSQLFKGIKNTPSILHEALSDIGKFKTQSNKYYRIVRGQEAANDFLMNNIVRTGDGDASKIMLGNKKIDMSRPSAYPSFSKGKYNIKYAKDDADHYLIETDRPMKVSNKGRHGKGTTQFPVDEQGNYMAEFPASQAKIYKNLGNDRYMEINKNEYLSNKINDIPKITGEAKISDFLSNDVAQSDIDNIIIEKIKHYRTPEFKNRIQDLLKMQGIDKNKADDLIEMAIKKTSDKSNIHILNYRDYEDMADELVKLSNKNPNLLAPGTTADDIASSLGFHIEPDDVLDKSLADKIAVKYSSIEKTKNIASHEIAHKAQHSIFGKTELTMDSFLGKNIKDPYMNGLKEVDARFSDLYKKLKKPKYSNISKTEYDDLKLNLKYNSDAKDLINTFSYDELIKLSKKMPMFSILGGGLYLQSQKLNK